MTEKLERLVSSGVETVHIGVRAQPKGIRCQTMERYAAWLEEHGIRVVWKTHYPPPQKATASAAWHWLNLSGLQNWGCQQAAPAFIYVSSSITP